MIATFGFTYKKQKIKLLNLRLSLWFVFSTHKLKQELSAQNFQIT